MKNQEQIKWWHYVLFTIVLLFAMCGESLVEWLLTIIGQ